MVTLELLGGIFEELGVLKTRVNNPRDLMNALAVLMRRSFSKNFEAKGRPETWPPLSAATIARKMALFRMGKIRGRINGRRVRLMPGQINAGALPGILIETGAMKDALTRRGVQGNIHRLSSDGRVLEVGVGAIKDPESGEMLDYPRRHQEGDGVPRRMIVLVQDEDLAAISKVTSAYLAGRDPREYLSGGGDDS